MRFTSAQYDAAIEALVAAKMVLSIIDWSFQDILALCASRTFRNWMRLCGRMHLGAAVLVVAARSRTQANGLGD